LRQAGNEALTLMTLMTLMTAMTLTFAAKVELAPLIGRANRS